MSIQELKIPCIVYDAAHKVACLFVVEKAQIQGLEFVVEAASKLPHQIPCRAVRKVIAEEPEQNTQKVKPKKYQGQPADRYDGGVVDPLLHYTCHGGKHLRSREIDGCKAESSKDRDNIKSLVPRSLFSQFP